MAGAQLELIGLRAGYGPSTVIENISLSLPEGGRLALLGRNGVGKSTLIRTVMGLTTRLGGQVLWRGRDISGEDPSARARLGIGWVPQERRVFRNLTVRENLEVAARPGHWTLERVFTLLPRLRERQRNLGWQLSGGEQQLLAIGRALTLNPVLLLLDEPLEGLAPVMAELVLDTLRGIAASNMGIVIVEQHAADALEITQDAIVMDRGQIVARSPSAALLRDTERLEALTGVGL
ncbi:ABC transporter ATP-binding protein [Aureimonas populi]|uniref:ABC transporter ATP-binding protein n=1 Tax=Aureimonas populi TaxID=1701758 RepID=A0ABW5CP56_9HYPH|nr:ABC transporter ATP-binding protein [Aureimonas populi]